jgi:hypothetical protein
MRACPAVRWIVTIEGSSQDIERLVAAYPDLRTGDGGREAVLTFDDGHDEATDATREGIRQEIETSLRHINGSGKLRWGRSFEGVGIKGGVKYVDAAGRSGQVVFMGSAHAHLTPKEFGDLMERLGHPRPDPPFGSAEVEALDVAQVAELADGDPIVARVLRLIDLMLVGDEDIDWSAAYSALETIEMDAKDEWRGWYSVGRRKRLTQTANSIEAVGIRSRHGHPFDAPKNPMSPVEASWFIRGAAALWLTWRLARDASASA